jgi:hypothetical protein
MLTKTNYNDWDLLMKVKLQAQQLWDAVEFTDAEFHEDRLALDALLASVSSKMVSSLVDKPTSKDAWDSIVASHIGIDRVWKATVQKLCQEWDRLTFRLREDADDFAFHLSGLVQQLAWHGDGDIDEQKVVKYLHVIPKKYTQITLSIETLLDLSALSIEEVTGRLKAVDDRNEALPTNSVTSDGKLLFTEEQWLAHQKEKKQQEGSSSSKDRRQQPRTRDKSGDGQADGRARGGGGGKVGAGGGGERKVTHDDVWHNCGHHNH